MLEAEGSLGAAEHKASGALRVLLSSCRKRGWSSCSPILRMQGIYVSDARISRSLILGCFAIMRSGNDQKFKTKMLFGCGEIHDGRKYKMKSLGATAN